MIEIILLIIIIFIAANILIFFALNVYFRKPASFSNDIKISIIIAAKNEEKNISQLINSLSSLDYPKENFEVIIVDDNSTDNTFNDVKKLIPAYSNFFVYKADNKIYPAKKGALQFGIDNAKHPFIIITDADCQPAKDWLKAFAGKFSEGFDFVNGPVIFYPGSRLVNKISSFERLRNSILTFALAEINFPYTASGANFGFKKASFEKLNGYSNTLATFSGDDDLLLHQAVRHKMKTGTINSRSAFVYTGSRNSFNEYFHQKSRHIKASFHYLLSRQLVLTAWHIINLVFLLSPLLGFICWWLVLPFLVKIIFDLIISLSFQKQFDYKFNITGIIYLQFFYEILLVVNFLNGLIKKDKWK